MRDYAPVRQVEQQRRRGAGRSGGEREEDGQDSREESKTVAHYEADL